MLDPTDGLVAICTTRDNLHAWIDAGQAMSAVWLRATLGGLAVTPVSQVIEVELNTSPSSARAVLLHRTRPDPAAHRLARGPARATAPNATALARGRAAPLTGARAAGQGRPRATSRRLAATARSCPSTRSDQRFTRPRAAVRPRARPSGDRRVDHHGTHRSEYFQQVPHRHHAGELLAREHRQVTDVSLTHQAGSRRIVSSCCAVTTPWTSPLPP